MHILPPHDPRRPSSNDQDPSNHNNRDTSTPHYHYHAAGDAEERIRREAVRDHLVDEILRRDARRRRRWKLAAVFGTAGILLSYAAARLSTVPPTNADTAVQVSTEYRDGKWVATAERVPATTPSANVRPLESYAGYAPGSANAETSTTSDEVNPDDYAEGSGESDAPDIISRYRMTNPRPDTAASRRCQGHYISDLGAVLAINDRSASFWTKSDVQQGKAVVEPVPGQPTDTGLLFRPANGYGTGQLLCYSDHVTFTLGNGAQFNLTRATAADAEETLTAWMMER